ncbi:MAG: DNA polymerase III subunit delta' [Kovacikia sp.]
MLPFSPLLGQSQAVELLTQAVARQRIAPAYLFAGPPGVGRGLAAECFIKLLFGSEQEPNHGLALQHRIQARNHPDLLWVEPTYLHQGKRLSVTEAIAAGIRRKSAPLIRLEQVREIARFLSRAPLEAPRSMVVIEQAETMAEGAANGLLKTLEEPGQATLILIAPGVESLLPTLVSRCQRIPFYRLAAETMAQVLQNAHQAEILQNPEVLQLAQGSPGEAIAHWQQLQEIPPDLLQAVTHLPASYREALDLARQIDKTLEPETQRWLIDYLQQNYWQHLSSNSPLAAQLLPIQLLEKARQYLLQNVQPRLVWEVMLVKMVQA